MLLFKKYFLLLVAFILVTALSAKNSNSSPYTVTASLDNLIPGINFSTYGGYPVKLIIENTSRTKRTFLMMTCSWQDGWKIDDKDFYLKSPICDSNHHEHITLAPGQKKIFYGLVLRRSFSEKNKILGVRFGFVEFTDSLFSRNIRRIITEHNNKTKLHRKPDEYEGANIYWSNRVPL